MATNNESLHSLISNKEWDGVIQRVQQLRAQHAHNEVRIPELHETESTLDMTPLYAALMPEHAAPRSVIEALLDAHTIQDTHDFLPNPLLSACAISNSFSVVTRMLQYQPSFILETDEQKKNVLHVVLQHQPTLELVKLLVTTWAWESSSSTSLDQAWKQLLQTYDGHGVLPIHYAIEHHADAAVILTLLEKFPKSAYMTLKRDVDISTMHHAAFHGCTYPVLKALLLAYGPLKLGDSGKSRKNKDTPLHLLFHPDVKHYWLQQQQNTGDMSRYKMAWYLIQQYSVTLKRDFGVKKGNKTEQAYKLVFSTRGACGKSVYHMTEALAKQYPTCAPLALLKKDFDDTIYQHSREWPQIDYNDEKE